MTNPSEYADSDTMLLPDVSTLAHKLMNEHGLIEQGVYFDFDRSKSRLGACHFKGGEPFKITMSALITPGQSYANIRNTLLHEIAHALVGSKAAHGPVWKRKAREIGCTGDRCGKIESPVEFRWFAVCHKCEKRVGMHRAPNRVRSCSQCSPWGFSWKHVLGWEQNGKETYLDEMPVKFQHEYQRLRNHFEPINP